MMRIGSGFDVHAFGDGDHVVLGGVRIAHSRGLLAQCMAMVRDRGFELANMDATLICEFPKINPHVAAMRARLAEVMQCDAGRVSVKATTTETLGFTGRGEGIAAQATVLLESR